MTTLPVVSHFVQGTVAEVILQEALEQSSLSRVFGGFLLGVTHLLGLKFDPDGGLLYAHLMFFLILIVMPSGISQWRR